MATAKHENEAVEDAFPGAQVIVELHDGRFEMTMRQHGRWRALKAAKSWWRQERIRWIAR